MSNRKEYSVFHMHVIDGEIKKESIQAIRHKGEYVFTKRTAIKVLNEIKFDLTRHSIVVNEYENRLDYKINGSIITDRIEIKKAIRIE